MSGSSLPSPTSFFISTFDSRRSIPVTLLRHCLILRSKMLFLISGRPLILPSSSREEDLSAVATARLSNRSSATGPDTSPSSTSSMSVLPSTGAKWLRVRLLMRVPSNSAWSDTFSRKYLNSLEFL